MYILFYSHIYFIYHEHALLSFNTLFQYVVPSCIRAFKYYVSLFNSSATLGHWGGFKKIQGFKQAVSVPKWQGALGMSVEPKGLPVGHSSFSTRLIIKVARNSFLSARCCRAWTLKPCKPESSKGGLPFDPCFPQGFRFFNLKKRSLGDRKVAGGAGGSQVSINRTSADSWRWCVHFIDEESKA